MFRVVFDTNVLVSAMLSEGKSHVLLRKAVSKKFTLVVSDLILEEFEDVIQRPKFRFTVDEFGMMFEVLMQTVELVDVVSNFNVVERDFKDNMVLETAYDGKADFIVSGDDHLLSLKRFRNINIVSVKEMLDYLEEKQ
ncbi:MAG: putative toxin-antitoxin system toxin component, PIN family [Candidatus Bathyarchaeota archaeon]|nr:putative toxin-antitoxin system toxin component, PIN family [Candidatus Termiticorpusculum sp.]